MAHLEWDGTVDEAGNKRMVWVDDLTQEEIDAKNKAALQYDPNAAKAMNNRLGGDSGGYSMNTYMADPMNSAVGNYAYDKNAKMHPPAGEEELNKMAAEQEKREKAAAEAKQQQKETADAIRRATYQSLASTIPQRETPQTKGEELRNRKKWTWRV